MSNTTDQFCQQTKEATDDLLKLGANVRDAAQAKLGQVGERAAKSCAQAQEKVHGIACVCSQYVRDRPMGSVLMAAGIGWLLGRFWKGR